MPPRSCGKPSDRFYVIKASDVGKTLLCAFGRNWSVPSQWGRTLKRDVGKRVFNQGDFLAIENDSQLSQRKSKTGR